MERDTIEYKVQMSITQQKIFVPLKWLLCT